MALGNLREESVSKRYCSEINYGLDGEQIIRFGKVKMGGRFDKGYFVEEAGKSLIDFTQPHWGVECSGATI